MLKPDKGFSPPSEKKAYPSIQFQPQIQESQFYEKRIEGLKLGYHGRKSHLLEEERQEIIDWLQTKDFC